eukprot:12428579-Karenia_brevis.AAC.1
MQRVAGAFRGEAERLTDTLEIIGEIRNRYEDRIASRGTQNQPEPRRAPDRSIAAVEAIHPRGRWAPVPSLADLPPRPPPPQRANSNPAPQRAAAPKAAAREPITDLTQRIYSALATEPRPDRPRRSQRSPERRSVSRPANRGSQRNIDPRDIET